MEGAIELRRIVEKALTDVQDVVATFFSVVTWRRAVFYGVQTTNERTYDQTAACPHRRERERNLNVDEVFENYTISVCFYLDYINLLLAG